MIGLCLLALGAVGARAQGPGANVSTIGRLECVLPPSLSAGVSLHEGIAELSIQPRAGLHLDAFDYPWRAAVAHGLTAARFIALTLDPAAYEDFRLVEPEHPLDVQGYPARIFAFTHLIRDPNDRGRSLRIEERYLVIQRRWGFTVIRHMDCASFFSDGLADYNLLIRGLRLLPEPPGSPRLILLGAGLALLLAAGLIAVLFHSI